MLDFSLMAYKNEIIDDLCNLIRIDSVKSDAQSHMPYGKKVFEALMYMLNLAESLDLDNVNLFSRCGYVEYGEGDDLFVILTHLDVVPAGDGWTVPPFEGIYKDGRVYGRGAIDDKGAAVCALYVLHALKENCKSLNKRVRLIFGCDEESGWSDMEYYLNNTSERPVMAFSPDASFPVINSEKGMCQLIIEKSGYAAEGKGIRLREFKGGERINIVPDRASAIIEGDSALLKEAMDLFNENTGYALKADVSGGELYVYAEGISAHGAKPEEGRNALMMLVGFLNTLPMKKSPACDAIYKLSAFLDSDCFGKKLGIACSNKMGELTVNFGFADITEESVKIGIDIRYPSCITRDTIIDSVKKAFDGYSVSVKHELAPHYVPEDSELVKGLLNAYETVTGDKAYCVAMGGATYARIFENSVAFGPLFPGDESLEHQANEYIYIDSLIKAGEVMAEAIMNLCT